MCVGVRRYSVHIWQILANVCIVHALSSEPKWHLQRIVQREPLTTSQHASKSIDLTRMAANLVNVYIIDSGVRISHKEFSGNRALFGTNIANPGAQPSDCAGHGTHVAALAVGKYSGVATKARAISVKVLDCFGRGFCSDILGALEWVAEDSAIRRKKGERSVAVMSVGSNDTECAATLKVTQQLWDSGVVITAAAGNDRSDACELYPARNPGTMAIGATDIQDRMFQNNNVGDCIDIFAPGVQLSSAWGSSSDTQIKNNTGTSMAAPIVAGVAALILGADPSLSSDEVRQILISSSSRNRILKPFTDQIMTAAVNRLVFAPWSRLFDEVPMNENEEGSSDTANETSRNFPIDDTSWNISSSIVAISMTLRPRTMPAMFYAVNRISSSLASVVGLRARSIVSRRANGVTVFANGSEPTTVQLVFYMPMMPSLIFTHTNKLIAADLSGELALSSSETFTFADGSIAKALQVNVTVPNAVPLGSEQDADRENGSTKDLKKSNTLNIVLIVIGSMAALGLLVAIGVLVVIPKASSWQERRASIAAMQAANVERLDAYQDRLQTNELLV